MKIGYEVWAWRGVKFHDSPSTRVGDPYRTPALCMGEFYLEIFHKGSRVGAGARARSRYFSDVILITGVSMISSVNPHVKVCCKYKLHVNLITPAPP